MIADLEFEYFNILLSGGKYWEKMTTNLLGLVPIIWSIVFAVSNTVFAQNSTTQASATMNSTETTKGITMNSTGIAKLHLEEAIKALENGNEQAAYTRLTAALQGIAQASNDAKMHFNEGMKALTAGNITDSLMHLNATKENLK